MARGDGVCEFRQSIFEESADIADEVLFFLHAQQVREFFILWSIFLKQLRHGVDRLQRLMVFIHIVQLETKFRQ